MMLAMEWITFLLFAAGAIISAGTRVTVAMRGRPRVLVRVFQQPDDYTPVEWRVYRGGVWCCLLALLLMVLSGAYGR
jgi:hypothetical protein